MSYITVQTLPAELCVSTLAHLTLRTCPKVELQKGWEFPGIASCGVIV